MKTALATLTVCLTFLAGIRCVEAATVTLYDGSGLPAAQGWLVPGAINSGGANVPPSETVVLGGVQVDTAANEAEYSGYSNYNPSTSSFVNPSFPTLDRTVGYSFSFNVALNSTTNSSDNRATFSVTVISSDGLGIELGFESGLVFGQSADFIRLENATFNTAALANYTLTVLGNSYTLSSGSQTLTGPLRNYNFNPATSNPPLSFNPYQIGNFLAFADNTGQESGTFTLGATAVTTNAAAVPYEFNPTLGLLIVGFLAITRSSKKYK